MLCPWLAATVANCGLVVLAEELELGLVASFVDVAVLDVKRDAVALDADTDWNIGVEQNAVGSTAAVGAAAGVVAEAVAAIGVAAGEGAATETTWRQNSSPLAFPLLGVEPVLVREEEPVQGQGLTQELASSWPRNSFLWVVQQASGWLAEEVELVRELGAVLEQELVEPHLLAVHLKDSRIDMHFF